MIPNGHDGPSAAVSSREAVAKITGGAFVDRAARSPAGLRAGAGRSSWSTSTISTAAEAAVADILAADGTVVAVRADLADDLDVQRLFAEAGAVFAGVYVVVHTTTDSGSMLYRHAALHVRAGGAIVVVSCG